MNLCYYFMLVTGQWQRATKLSPACLGEWIRAGTKLELD